MAGLNFIINTIKAISAAVTVYGWLAAGGIGSVILALTLFWEDRPRTAGALLTIGMWFLAIATYGFIVIPPRGQFWPTWQRWLHKNPLRHVSLELGTLQLGTTSVVGETIRRPTVVFAFTCRIRPQRRGLMPKKFYLETPTRRRIPVKIQCVDDWHVAEKIEELPPGEWCHCCARFLLDENLPDDGITNHPTSDQFLRMIGEFDLVFEYDGGVLRRHYSAKALKRIVHAQLQHHTQPPKRSAVLRPASHERD